MSAGIEWGTKPYCETSRETPCDKSQQKICEMMKMCDDCPVQTKNEGIRVTLDEGATLPTRGTEEAGGLDLYASETVYVGRRSTLVPTGVHMAIPKGYVGLIRSRSGMAYKNNVYTEAGVIDSDYRGSIGVVMYYNCVPNARWAQVASYDNDVEDKYKINKGDRVAQLLIVPVNMQNCVEVQSLDDTVRGEGGYGSTGK